MTHGVAVPGAADPSDASDGTGKMVANCQSLSHQERKEETKGNMDQWEEGTCSAIPTAGYETVSNGSYMI